MMSTETQVKRRGGRCVPYAAAERRITVSAFLLPADYEWAREQAAALGVGLGRFVADAVSERRLKREEESAGAAPNPLQET